VLGIFRNTYYDFPSEVDFTGPPASLHDARCGTIADVPRGFHDAICVQGSGILKSGRTVSFAKRDCECADVCPRTGERICFEALDPARFPWGRGALGTAITPLLTVAVDDSIVKMGTALYVPEFDGLPVDVARSRVHDGCFIAQDRGIRVKGQHLDVFTGFSAVTELWNRLVPSNHGVTVVVDSPRCARASVN
jgi:3D (Asp-Asp-Asp) domain-containing protein